MNNKQKSQLEELAGKKAVDYANIMISGSGEYREGKQDGYYDGYIAGARELAAYVHSQNLKINQLRERVKELEDYAESKDDRDRLVRELDEIINGKEGMAKQASLCDIVSQMRTIKKPLFLPPSLHRGVNK